MLLIYFRFSLNMMYTLVGGGLNMQTVSPSPDGEAPVLKI